jgi:ribosomal protein L9
MKPFRDYFRNYIILNEFTQATIDKLVKKFEKDAPKEEIERELRDFEKYKTSLELKDPFQYKTWVDLTQAVHGAKGKSQFKKKKQCGEYCAQKLRKDKFLASV